MRGRCQPGVTGASAAAGLEAAGRLQRAGWESDSAPATLEAAPPRLRWSQTPHKPAAERPTARVPAASEPGGGCAERIDPPAAVRARGAGASLEISWVAPGPDAVGSVHVAHEDQFYDDVDRNSKADCTQYNEGITSRAEIVCRGAACDQRRTQIMVRGEHSNSKLGKDQLCPAKLQLAQHWRPASAVVVESETDKMVCRPPLLRHC